MKNIKTTFKTNFPKINLIYLGWFIAIILTTILFSLILNTYAKELINLEQTAIPLLQQAMQQDNLPSKEIAMQTKNLLETIGLFVYLYLLSLIILGTLKNKIIFQKIEKKKVSLNKILLTIFTNFFLMCLMIYTLFKSINLFKTPNAVGIYSIIFIIFIFCIQNLITFIIFEEKRKHLLKKTLKTILSYYVSTIILIVSLLLIYILAYFIGTFHALTGFIISLILGLSFYLTLKEIYFLYLYKIYR